MGNHGWWGACESVLCWIVPLIFLLCMGGMVMMFAKGGCTGMRHGFAGGPEARPDTAGEVLDRRFARGEITREQYEEMKRDLEASRGGTL